jgi:hypothetical protein
MKRYHNRFSYIPGVIGQIYKAAWNEKHDMTREDLLSLWFHVLVPPMAIWASFSPKIRDPVTRDYLFKND